MSHRPRVVDASVAIKLFIDEDSSDLAHGIFSCLTENPPGELWVPDLFYAECGNMLWKLIRFHGYPYSRARANLRDLTALALRSAPLAGLIEPALTLAAKHEVTVYDACYLALAQRLSIPLVTADEKLARKLAASRPEVQTLSGR